MHHTKARRHGDLYWFSVSPCLRVVLCPCSPSPPYTLNSYVESWELEVGPWPSTRLTLRCRTLFAFAHLQRK
jgi:hypothetical protein